MAEPIAFRRHKTEAVQKGSPSPVQRSPLRHIGEAPQGGAVRRMIDRTRFLCRMGTTARTALLAGTGGSLLRLLAPFTARAAAVPKGLWLGSTRGLTTGNALAYTDPASGDPAILLRLATGRYVSYDALCTHQGCTVLYDTRSKMLVCPCHGATFNPTRQGIATSGPTSIPLMPLPVVVTAAGDAYLLGAKPGPRISRLRPALPYSGRTGDGGDGGQGGGDGGDGGQGGGDGSGGDDGAGAVNLSVSGHHLTVPPSVGGKGFVSSPLGGGPTTGSQHAGTRHLGRHAPHRPHGDD